MTPGRTLLAIFAHPDDETFLAGPIIAKYAHEGVRVELVVATPPLGPDPELECAAKRLGISRVHYLGYADSGMPGGRPASPSDPAPNGSHAPSSCTETRPRQPAITAGSPIGGGAVTQAPLDVVAGQIQRIMAEVRPQAVLVDSPYGAYGHPDHIVVHRAAVVACTNMASATSAVAGVPGGMPPSGDRASQDTVSPIRLYALAFPLPLVRMNLRLLKLRGVPVDHMGPNGDIDLQAAVRSAGRKTGLVSTSRYVRYRRLAASCYEDEIKAAPLPLKLLERSPLWVQRLIFSRQAVTRLISGPDGFERDMLA